MRDQYNTTDLAAFRRIFDELSAGAELSLEQFLAGIDPAQPIVGTPLAEQLYLTAYERAQHALRAHDEDDGVPATGGCLATAGSEEVRSRVIRAWSNWSLTKFVQGFAKDGWKWLERYLTMAARQQVGTDAKADPFLGAVSLDAGFEDGPSHYDVLRTGDDVEDALLESLSAEHVADEQLVDEEASASSPVACAAYTDALRSAKAAGDDRAASLVRLVAVFDCAGRKNKAMLSRVAFEDALRSKPSASMAEGAEDADSAPELASAAELFDRDPRIKSEMTVAQRVLLTLEEPSDFDLLGDIMTLLPRGGVDGFCASTLSQTLFKGRGVIAAAAARLGPTPGTIRPIRKNRAVTREKDRLAAAARADRSVAQAVSASYRAAVERSREDAIIATAFMVSTLGASLDASDDGESAVRDSLAQMVDSTSRTGVSAAGRAIYRAVRKYVAKESDVVVDVLPRLLGDQHFVQLLCGQPALGPAYPVVPMKARTDAIAGMFAGWSAEQLQAASQAGARVFEEAVAA